MEPSAAPEAGPAEPAPDAAAIRSELARLTAQSEEQAQMLIAAVARAEDAKPDSEAWAAAQAELSAMEVIGLRLAETVDAAERAGAADPALAAEAQSALQRQRAAEEAARSALEGAAL